MKTIRRAFVLLLAVLMLVGMALPACAEELAPDAEPIVEESAPEVTTEPEITTEPEVTPEPTATPEPVPADEAAPLALESESDTIFLTLYLSNNKPDMLQGNTIRLTEDLDLSDNTVVIMMNETVTLDLNGHTLTVGSLRVDSNATLTLTDSVGTGCIKGSIYVVGSKLVLNGGTVTSTATETSTLSGTIEKGTGTTVFNGPVNINSGTTVSGGVFNGAVTNNGTISGGTFNGNVTGDGSITGGVFYGSVPTDKLLTDKPVYTVSFDLNGGSGSIPDQVFVNTDTAAAIKPATNPTRDGYAFLGWYKSGESDPYDFNSPVTSSFTLEAHWQSYGYKINYVPNVGTLPTSYPTGYATGIAATLPAPTKTGFTFYGWYTNADLSGDAVTQIAKGSTGDKEFHAKWTENLPSGGGGDDPTGGSDDDPTGGSDDDPTGGDDNPSGGDDNPSGGGSAKAPSSATKPVGVPKTGDESMVVLWLALAAVSALALGYVTLRKRKN